MKKILFITGTRADFGKIKPLIRAVHESGEFAYSVFVTGMHLLSRYGFTLEEVRNNNLLNIHSFMNQMPGEPMEMILANTVHGLSRYVQEFLPDLIVVHGDRVESLASAIVGSMQNILVAHIEGGELSGTIDELIRHSTSKLSHIHFVANQDAKSILERMGEDPSTIFPIGSPDIDIMMSKDLPALEDAKKWYEINFQNFSLVLFHPVTTEVENLDTQVSEVVNALLMSDENYVVIYPNNDLGSEVIINHYEKLKKSNKFRVFPSIRFEFFLSLLKGSSMIIGNSSAGIREAPVYGVPTVNIGTRQSNRFQHASILNVAPETSAVLRAIAEAAGIKDEKFCTHFGDGKSAERFMSVLRMKSFWEIDLQKRFHV